MSIPTPLVANRSRPEGAMRVLARDVLLLDNVNSDAFKQNTISAEQFIPDGTGNMYMLYTGTGTSGTGICLAKATGTLANPASPDPRVNAFTDLGVCRTTTPANIAGDGPCLVIANGFYFLFAAASTSAGAVISCYHAPQLSGGAVVPLSTAMTNFSPAANALVPASANVTSLASAQGAAGGTLLNQSYTWAVCGIDADGTFGGLVTTSLTPTLNTKANLTWTASATGETGGYAVFQQNGASYLQIATVAHGTAAYTVTGSETQTTQHPGYTSASCTRLDEPYVFYDNVAGQWRMLVMGFNAAGTMEQTHLANLSSAGYASLTSGAFTFRKQNNSQPVLPAGNYASVFGTTIPGGSSMATTYDYECVADPFVFQAGSYFVIGYTAGAQGAIATTGIYRVALAYTKDFSTYTKMGIMRYPSAIKNPADASNGAALDGNSMNRACSGSWRGAMYVDANGIGHMPCIGTHANGGSAFGQAQAYYYQFDFSGVIDAINGLRPVDPWVRVEAESTDARLAFTGFASISGNFPYFSGGAIAGAGGKARFSATPSDSITFTFNGCAVRVIISRISSARPVTVTLDGGGTEGVNQFTSLDMTANAAAGSHCPQIAAQFDNLTPGVHQLTVAVTASGGANNLFVDAFDYIPQPGLPA